MELDSIECVSSTDGMDEDEIHHHTMHHQYPHHGHHQFSSSKPHNGTNNTNNSNTINSIMGPTAIAPATSVHELLECPVCTNSMYPPIHQVFLQFHYIFVYCNFGGFAFFFLLILLFVIDFVEFDWSMISNRFALHLNGISLFFVAMKDIDLRLFLG